MNHKEALQKIVELKPNNQSTINESLTEWANNVLNIATEALQSESKCTKCGSLEIESMTPRTTYACGSSDYDQRPNTFIQSEQCQSIQSEKRMYSEERIYRVSFDNHLQAEISVNSNCIEVLKAVNGWGDSVIKEKITIEHIQPKTEEVKECNCNCWDCDYCYPRMIAESKGEQPTSPSIEKMAEERYPKNSADKSFDYAKGYRDAFIEGYKANNQLDELEKYVENDKGWAIVKTDLLNKIQELKTKQ